LAYRWIEKPGIAAGRILAAAIQRRQSMGPSEADGLAGRTAQQGEAEMAETDYSRGPQDHSVINLSRDHEVRYWADKFGVSQAALEDAVRKVGSSAPAVEEELWNAR
ncbi:DUF3606 domain-containing protein, partial [Bosea sp. TAF32]|uniref:DUF3606 domain-containing protein n=1 Tax=Bosea sp. TAF32 TaxID=3237482 RepID=UPI003F92038D